MDSPEDLVNLAPGTITVWADIGCPWASLALHTLHAQAQDRGIPLLVDHRAFPLELFNRRGTPKIIIDLEVTAIASLRPELGWRPWNQPDSTYPVTMLPPMEAVQAAKDPAVGGLLGSAELDAALRRAFYADGRCISLHSVILEVAEECTHVDFSGLGVALARGEGRQAVYEQWEVAQRPDVQGSPHLFTAGGYQAHNPGAVYHWTASPPTGFPRLEEYCAEWVDDLLATLE